ncbi:ABC transporter substrate-binding protein [Mycolicibacterium sp. YH-1]|uniref:ABC transporter substrate-binding protein n=1 Tax=Mycolicibacterium sp. YH-1 TaxID=2908837 RepID=UPI001F4BFB2D|nr:ABC transporter substrate-binding protein [Mycolicibacterium sp. YH-1]UNB52926.1 ABC transporter substrate-binding protein [Mycolicibacterium sp. YH-1]
MSTPSMPVPPKLNHDPDDRRVNSRRRRWARPAGIVMALILGLSACASPSETGTTATEAVLETGGGPQGDPTRGGEVRIAVTGGGPSTPLDPNSQSYLIDGLVKSAVYDRLTTINPESGAVEMSLATSMTPNDTATEWTIELRPGVLFSDGRPLTSNDVLFTLKRIKDDALADSTMRHVDLERSSSSGPTRLTLVLTKPIADLPAVLAAADTFSIIPDGSKDPATVPPPGTGPYAIANYTPGVQVDLTANKQYREPGKPYLDRLTLVEINDPSAALNALKAGQVDIATRFNFAAVPSLVNDPGIYLRASNVGMAAANYYMNEQLAPFDNPAVRKAMRLAVDRERCVKVALNGYGHVGNDLWGEAHPSYNKDLPQREYNPEEAKKILAEAGVTTPVAVTLYAADYGAGMLECAQVIQQSAKAAGFDVTVKQVSSSELYGPNIFTKVPMGSDYWAGTSFEGGASGAMVQGAPFPEFGMDDKEFDAKFDDARATLDVNERNRKYQALQKELWENGANIVWGFQDVIWGIANRVGGTEAFDLPTNSTEYHGLEDLWVQN